MNSLNTDLPNKFNAGHSAQIFFAPGKVILLGEHAAVYGQPALVGPLQQGARALVTPAPRTQLVVGSALARTEKSAVHKAFDRVAAEVGHPPVLVRLEASLPKGVGLGSSAAISVATSKALLGTVKGKATHAKVMALAQQMEQVFHGSPSGVDVACSVHQRLILFQRRPSGGLAVTPISSPRPLPIVVALLGARAPTKQTVGALRARYDRRPKMYQQLFRQIGSTTREATASVQAGDIEGLGEAMNVNQGLLAALRLSSNDIDTLVYQLRRLGALGAKLTGAGGGGGAVIGLFKDTTSAVRSLKRQGIVCFASDISGVNAE